MKELDYEQDLKINPEELDIEWLDQPQTFMRYAEAAANARLKMDRAKEHLDVIRAETDSRIRSNPNRFNIEGKVTEGAISAAILQQQDYQDVQDQFNEAHHNYNIMQAAVKAFDQRKTALENLVRLQGQNYFSSPIEPRDLGSEYNAKKRREERTINKMKDDSDLSTEAKKSTRTRRK